MLMVCVEECLIWMSRVVLRQVSDERQIII